MDKEAKLERKRDQRHRREITAKLDRTVSDYVRYKYPSVYAEAEEYYTQLNSKYPTKKDLIKTVEHTVWKKKTREQRTTYNKRMELKIHLLQDEKKKTEVIDSTANEETTTEAIDSTANEETRPDKGVSCCFITLTLVSSVG